MDNSLTPMKQFLNKFHPPGKIIFAKIWGSRGYNTNKEDSDTDFTGVYLCPTSEILSLDAPKDIFKHDKQDTPNISKEEHPDYQFFEINKFCHLLIKGNPSIIEMLFTDRLFIFSPEWELLRKERTRFLSKQVVHQYLGYMDGQLKRLLAHNGQKGLHTKGGKYNEKWAYNIIRLSGDVKKIAQGQEPSIWKEGSERDLLMKIRNDEYEWEEVKILIEKSIASVEELKPFPIPDQCDKEFLNDWLLKLRKDNW